MVARIALLAVALVATSVPASEALAHHRPARVYAQQGGRTCHTDADCHSLRLPRPRVCPNGGQSVPSACCRMNYCGICWTDCNPTPP